MTLISIIGDFHSSILPISYEFREQMGTHIIVYDNARCNVKNAERLVQGQKAYLKCSANCDYRVLAYGIDGDSYENIMECLEYILAEAKLVDDVYLNATHGLSSVGLVLSHELLLLGAKVIAYDRFANRYNLHTSNGMHKKQMTHNMDIATHLQLKGYTLRKYSNPKEMAKRKEGIISLCKNLSEFKAFTSKLQGTNIDNIAGYETYKKTLQDMGKYKATTFTQGTVFEEYIYHLIVDNFDFDDVMTGVLIEVETGVQNEIDILMIKDNHLHTIECKLVNGLDGEHFVYKTDLVMEYLDDDGKAMILSIGGKNERRTKSGKRRVQFSQGDKARAKYGDINIHQREMFDEERFLRDVREWFLNRR